jgi:type II secretory pathway predicted ATPase ExeA/cell division septation protein DedD
MYYDHFGLYTAPFSMGPHLQFLFKSNTFEETMAHLVYGIEGGESIILITGEIGTGKTLALHNLTEHISGTFRVALINVTKIDFRELLKMFVAELGIAMPPESDRADLLGALKVEIESCRRQGLRLLLIVDEAHNLDIDTLEGVRLLTNLGPSGEQILQVVLSGQPGLNETINRSELIQLRQRIRVHYHLESMSRDETARYLTHRLEVAGAETPLFKRDAIDRVHALSRGVPRVVNIVADRALLAAYVDGKDIVSARHVEEDPDLSHTVLRDHELKKLFEAPPPPAEAVKPAPPPPPAEVVKPEPPVASPPPLKTPPVPVVDEEPPSGDDEFIGLFDEDLEDDDEFFAAPLEEAEDEDESAPFETLHREPSMPAAAPTRPVQVIAEDEPSAEPTPDDDATPRRRSRLVVVLYSTLIVAVLGLAALGVVAYRQGMLDDVLLRVGLGHEEAGQAALPPFAPVNDAADVPPVGEALAELADSLEAVVAGTDSVPETTGQERIEFTAVIDTTRVERPSGAVPDTIPSGSTAAPSEYVFELLSGSYYVHVGSFRTVERAEVFAHSLAALGQRVAIIETTVAEQLWYRVYVGPFADESGAQAAQAEIRAHRLLNHDWSMIVRHR